MGSFHMHGVRYQTRDVDRAVKFYTQELGFELKHQQGEAFASVACDGVDLLLSGAASSGARPMPDGEEQSPGGWNRIVLSVSDLPAVVARMKARGWSSGTRCCRAPAAGRFSCSTRTTTLSSSSSRRHAAEARQPG